LEHEAGQVGRKLLDLDPLRAGVGGDARGLGVDAEASAPRTWGASS
jgi:hypothetical protein